jgi:hypothetical protein
MLTGQLQQRQLQTIMASNPNGKLTWTETTLLWQQNASKDITTWHNNTQHWQQTRRTLHTRTTQLEINTNSHKNHRYDTFGKNKRLNSNWLLSLDTPGKQTAKTNQKTHKRA